MFISSFLGGHTTDPPVSRSHRIAREIVDVNTMANHKEENKEGDGKVKAEAGEEREKGRFTCYREDIEVCV